MEHVEDLYDKENYKGIKKNGKDSGPGDIPAEFLKSLV